MIVVANRIFVKPEHAQAFEARLQERARLVERMPGFIANQVLRPLEPGAPYVIVTWWEAREHFEAWIRSDAFRQGTAEWGLLPRRALAAPSRLEVHEVLLAGARPAA